MVAYSSLVDGGSEHMGSENFSKMAGNIGSYKNSRILESLTKYSKRISRTRLWVMEGMTHKAQYMELIKAFE